MAHHGHDAFRALDMYDTDDLRAVSQRLKKAGSHNYGDTAVAMALDTYLMGRDESRCKADVGPLDLEAIESRAQRLMIATWECDKLSYTDQWQLTNCDVPALVAEVRRLHAEPDKAQAEVAEHRRHVATVMGREEALKKRVEELEDERDDAKEQATSLASLARVSKALAAKRAETIAAQQQHIEVLNRRLAERDADSETTRWCRHE